MTNPLVQLSRAGVSVWLDDLSRSLIGTGKLAELIETRSVVGVTTNPTIFAGALSSGGDYADQLHSLAGKSVPAAIVAITSRDVADACDVFSKVYEQSKGENGRVSIEVDPGLADETEQTLAQAKELWGSIARPNLMIKIPATKAGLPAITAAIATGISVNVTLIFSLQRYREVVNAYLNGLELARENGIELSTIRSVASFFVSRMDVEVDARLDAIGTDAALALRNRAGLANARLAYQAFEQSLQTERWELLAAQGAHVQRPLWASTGVKDPAMADTAYVDGLIAADTVNTMPGKTLEAVADHGVVEANTAREYESSQQVLDSLAALGISYVEVTDLLEREGVEKFQASWAQLTASVAQGLKEYA